MSAGTYWADETPWSNVTLRPDAPDNFGVYHHDPDEGPLCVQTFSTRAAAQAHADALNNA